MTPRILTVEDDREISELVALHLRQAGYGVEVVRDGETALARLDRDAWDLMVLDLTLGPGGPDGIDVCRRVRERDLSLPIVMLTGRADEVDRVLGLELGADDYVTKPFSVRELVARVRAVMRRSRDKAPEGEDESALCVDGLEVDPVRRSVRLDGRALELTPREFELLLHFARHPGRVFSRSALLDRVWGYAHDGYEHPVNSHINRLRAKLERDPARPRYILTVWGVGYRFCDPSRGD